VNDTTRPQVLQPGQASALEQVLEGLRSAGRPPVLVNTSFNGPGEPIVDSSADAIRCFRRLGLDFLVLADRLVRSDYRPQRSADGGGAGRQAGHA
jgi:carbamoyltransferase